MAGLPGLIIKITADTKDAVAGINRVESALGTPMGAFDKLGKTALAAGGALAAAFGAESVIRFLQDSMRAAMEDEKSMVALAKAMENVGVASQNASVEDFVRQLSMATGVADDQLRPALQKIVTATGDVAESQRALSLALDISTATGRDLDTVSQSLARAYSGQTTALGRLGVGLDAALLKSKDMDAITAALSAKFQGQASAAAETYSGRLQRITIAAQEAQETIGYALLQSLDRLGNVIGGTGGVTSLITKLGDSMADLINTMGRGPAIIDTLAAKFGVTTTATKLMNAAFDGMLEATKQVFGGPLYMGIKIFDQLTNREQANARAVSTLSARYDGLARSIQAANNQATARAGISTSMTVGGRDWGAFYQGNQAAQQALAESRANVNEIVREYEQAAKKASAVGGAGAAAAKESSISWKTATSEINSSLDGLSVSITGKMATVTEKVGEKFKTQFDAFKQIVGEQGAIIKQAQAALENYAKSVTDTILGKINFSQTMTDAEGKTVPMTPEQIVNMILGDISNQMTAVQSMAGIVTQLPEALAQKLLALPTTLQTQLANWLAAHPEMIKQLTDNYNALATFTQTALGIPMANTFAAIGGVSALEMIADARKRIAESASAFKNFVRSQLETTVRIKVVYDYPGGAPGPQPPGKAHGGPVSAGSAYIVGEVGPELFIPNQSGTIIPNKAMGGNTYNVNVSTGVGDPRQIGEQIVTYIKRFEQSSGQVFASA